MLLLPAPQINIHILAVLLLRAHIIGNDGALASKLIFMTKALKNTRCRMALLFGARLIIL